MAGYIGLGPPQRDHRLPGGENAERKMLLLSLPRAPQDRLAAVEHTAAKLTAAAAAPVTVAVATSPGPRDSAGSGSGLRPGSPPLKTPKQVDRRDAAVQQPQTPGTPATPPAQRELELSALNAQVRRQRGRA